MENRQDRIKLTSAEMGKINVANLYANHKMLMCSSTLKALSY
ncbi:hypothetical protein R4Z10_08215 [Niallia sp. XMNu-256]